jgi:integrase
MPLHAVPPPYRPSSDELALVTPILCGYSRRHNSANHRPDTARADLAVWQRFSQFTGRPFWRWELTDMNAYGDARRNAVAGSTLRREQGAIFRLLQFARDPAYPYDEAVYARTGRHIPQICAADNTARHRQAAATSKRRQFTAAELDRLFTAIRAHIQRLRARGKRQALAPAMHYAALCFALAFGTRAFETIKGDLEDLSPASSAEMRAFSAFEDFVVRFGKSHDGGGYKRRPVAAIAVFREYLAAVAWYLREIRPQLARAESPPAIFLSQRGARLRPDSLSRALRKYRDQARLSRDLTLHCLRHTFETVLRESGLDLATIKELMGHEHEASTAIYDHFSTARVRQRCLTLNQRLIAASERLPRLAP